LSRERRERAALVGVAAVLLAVLSGCGGMERTIDRVLPRDGTAYKTSGSLPPLEVPPGLTSSSIRDAYPVAGGGSATFSEYTAATDGGTERTSVASVAGVLPQLADVRVERSGDKRWLVVNAAPGQIWPRLRDFWLENGFLISFEDPSIGIMETAWAEKREDLPIGAVRRLLSRINTAAYAFATRDRFRVRLERGTTPGTTELYISHRGAEEKSQGDSFVWVPRPSDPELEAEMLNRIMISFGLPAQDADQLLASSQPRSARAEMVKDARGETVLALREDFSRAWRRTGLALDRVGFTVEDRDRSRGLFYVRYVDPLADEREKSSGWLDKLRFWGNKSGDPAENEFLISLVGGESTTQVLVLDKRGQRQSSGTADRILALLHDELK
jgi:outer membrane protein assembly factor BamC